MYLPILWLKDYVEINEEAKKIADELTLSGSHVESIIKPLENVKNIVVGKILSIEKHPNADKLLVTKVDIASEELIIVTGAKNLALGDFVPLALVGAVLSDGTNISETEFRGVLSYGMFCSLKELGFSDNVIAKEFKDGVFKFQDEIAVGTDVKEIFKSNESIIEFEITPNRPDCLSIIGMATETAATFDKKLKEFNIEIKNEDGKIEEYIDDVELMTENCIRYYSRVIKDVVIGRSPFWLELRLMEAGIRPINNIVDVTNYAMLEYGQPLHAFDLEKVQGKKIIVRQAEENEVIETLDGVERKLKANDIVIADSDRAIGIAGVMGGLNTEIGDNTKTVILEGANFNEKSVRLSSKQFGLRSEASSRFEKGIDPNLAEMTIERACQLIELIGAGKVVGGHIDKYSKKVEELMIDLRPERVKLLLGIEISTEQMIDYLNRLYLKTELVDNVLKVKVPTVRRDLQIEADLIEEIGRMYGFHNIESKPLVGKLTRGEIPYPRQIEEKAKKVLSGFGLTEVMTYSFISPKAFDKLDIATNDPRRNSIRLINPLGEDFSVMRTTLISNTMDLLVRNNNRSIDDFRVFEIGNTFQKDSDETDSLPVETRILCIGAYGDIDFYYIKDIFVKLLESLGIKELKFNRVVNNPSFHPGRTAEVVYKNHTLGIIGEIHPNVQKNYSMKERCVIGELNFDFIIEVADFTRKYKALPKYPSMIRDLAIVIDDDVMASDVIELVKGFGEELIEEVELFDIYKGGQIPENKKSLAFSVRYRSNTRTLKEEEVNAIQDNIFKELENKYNAKLRS